MSFKFITVRSIAKGVEVKLNRPDQRNAINKELLEEIHTALADAEQDSDVRIFALKGDASYFCSGMDFPERVAQITGEQTEYNPGQAVVDLLKRFSRSHLFIISLVEGEAIAGGVGLVAASDFAIATPTSTFALSEALWGLLPVNILPFIVRRTGFQKAYSMTLNTRKVTSEDALHMHLVDAVDENPNRRLTQMAHSLTCVSRETVLDAKRYFAKFWAFNPELEQAAVEELERLTREPRVINNIRRFVERGVLPWEAD